MSTRGRSISRGREGVINRQEALNGTGEDDSPRGRNQHVERISTGRGGAGNIVRSPSRDVEPELKGYVPSDKHASNLLSAGRGGAGNIRSPSREPPNAKTEAYERDVLARAAEDRDQVYSTGRGGAGNISHSRSRSRSQGPGLVHSAGRGGVGNISQGPGNVDADDTLERLKHRHAEGIHSTGRGGAANLTAVPTPNIDVLPAHEEAFLSSGRGGAGNIRSRSVSREPGSRGASKDRQGNGNPITHIWNKVIHPHGPHHIDDPNVIPEAAAEDTK